MKKNQQRKSKVLGGMAFGVFTIAMVLAIAGLAWTMTGIRETAISKTPTAILASVGVSEGSVVSLPVEYYDQVADECVNLYDLGTQGALRNRQFEWSECGYENKKIEQGIVEFELSNEHLPIAVGGKLTPNRGVVGDNFTRWFSEVDGKSVNYAGILKLDYQAEGARFSFYKEEFYPLDVVENANGEIVSQDGHNHLFTMDFAVPFAVVADGNENFTITADDDTWVYVDDKLVIDMGGVHDAATGRFMITKDGEVYSAVLEQELAYSGVTVHEGDGQLIRIFHADRNAGSSTFNIEIAGMNLTVMNTQLADNNGDGVQIAYDPSDSSYVAPLGETSVVQPDNSKGLVVMATIEGVLIVLFSVFVVISMRNLVRQKR